MAMDAYAAEANMGLACAGEVALIPAGTEPAIVVTQGQFDCCLAYLSAAEDASATRDAWAGAFGADPSAQNCCRVLIAKLDQGDSANLSNYQRTLGPVRDTCCTSGLIAPVDTLYAHILCTPWGPPVPPALDDASLETA
jgi:hypothetical protein